MFSISYLPTAERLTVVVVKARNLKFEKEDGPGCPFVKVYNILFLKFLFIEEIFLGLHYAAWKEDI